MKTAHQSLTVTTATITEQYELPKRRTTQNKVYIGSVFPSFCHLSLRGFLLAPRSKGAVSAWFACGHAYVLLIEASGDLQSSLTVAFIFSWQSLDFVEVFTSLHRGIHLRGNDFHSQTQRDSEGP